MHIHYDDIVEMHNSIHEARQKEEGRLKRILHMLGYKKYALDSVCNLLEDIRIEDNKDEIGERFFRIELSFKAKEGGYQRRRSFLSYANLHLFSQSDEQINDFFRLQGDFPMCSLIWKIG